VSVCERERDRERHTNIERGHEIETTIEIERETR